jgi:hypothetical protein
MPDILVNIKLPLCGLYDADIFLNKIHLCASVYTVCGNLHLDI